MDATGLGEMDLNYGLDFLRKVNEENKLNYTNANVRDAATGELILPEYLIVEKNGIKFGIISVLDPNYKIMTMANNDPEFEIQDPVTVLRELVPRVREEADTILLLSHLGDKNTDIAVKEVKGIDLCVIGHTFRSLHTERIVDDTAMLTATNEGKFLGRADLFIDDKEGQLMAFDVEIIDLGPEMADSEEVLQQIKEYKESFAKFQEVKRADFPRNLGSDKEQFLVDRSCMGCHTDAWNVYARSGHKKAFATLRNKGQNFEPECLSCHTTGYMHKNGYADARPYNYLVNVQCEACHGYGTEHSRDGKMAALAKDSCVICHDKENSPDFDYATYWEKIKH
jgi:2',3'-cyclic-nucleotide 2'-phosphodiesterase (5'-nucleotidase family)